MASGRIRAVWQVFALIAILATMIMVVFIGAINREVYLHTSSNRDSKNRVFSLGSFEYS